MSVYISLPRYYVDCAHYKACCDDEGWREWRRAEREVTIRTTTVLNLAYVSYTSEEQDLRQSNL